jgi:hypothetical protein
MRCYAMKGRGKLEKKAAFEDSEQGLSGRGIKKPHSHISFFVKTSHEKATHVNTGDTESIQVVLVTHATQRYLMKQRVE